MYQLKKSLGQHFLKDENICKKIIAALRQHPFTRLLEVGPGGGALTKYLLEIPDVDFKAVEVDEEKVKYLKSTFPSIKGKILHHDFLSVEKPFENKFSIVGNFPYNISSQILFRILEWKEDVECVTGMFQKEVAQRIRAKEGSKTYGVLSVLIQAFFDVEYLFEVSERSFQPPPKVKSAVIRLLPATKTPEMRSREDLFLLVKTSFNQRRKTLRNSVKNLFSKSKLEEKIFDKRPEQLPVQEFAALTFDMK
ncbi:MAG: ribosomal RNA small subunit methyltransferase A [Sphingobacteriales bacterium UTBCD1]|jgi:16S rRNA (adenine1518-N6/adenine1519-N6)-dimethyltransferase|nr:MAG: ribosomal RNA small subunit methyltransferase A [Sphingobacteriales bacterium UTBCD1]